MESKYKVVCIIPTGEEADLVYPIYKELERRDVSVVNIETGVLCCDSNTRLPSIVLKELGMSYKSLKDYGTKSMVGILQTELPTVMVIGSDQEYVRRSFLYAAQAFGIPVILLDVAFGSNALKGHWLTVRRTVYRLSHHFVNLLKKYAYVIKTVKDLGWGMQRIVQMVLVDIKQALTVEDTRGTYGCSLVVVGGEWQKEVLIERGVDPDRVVITGNPRMASLLRERNMESEKVLRSRWGIAEDDKVILFHTVAQVEHGRWNLAMRKAFVNRVIDSMTPLLGDNVRLVIRIHPVESLSEYEAIIKDRKERLILCKDLPFIDVIGISDVILFGGYSTMVLEATALGKIAVVLNMFNEVKNLPYEEMGIAVCLYQYDDIEPTVVRLLYDQSFKDECLARMESFHKTNKEFTDGGATERIAELIINLAKNHLGRNNA